MARSSPVRVINGAFKNVLGVEAVQKMIASIPDAVASPTQGALEQWGGDIVTTYQQIAPVAPEFEKHPGQMRDSAHVVADNGRALSVTVVVDAKADDGSDYPPKVEYGHRTANGGHVAGKPAFWPAYRVTKKKGRSRVSRAINKGVKSVKASGE